MIDLWYAACGVNRVDVRDISLRERNFSRRVFSVGVRQQHVGRTVRWEPHRIDDLVSIDAIYVRPTESASRGGRANALRHFLATNCQKCSIFPEFLIDLLHGRQMLMVGYH